MMKRFLLSLTILCIGAALLAQAPQSFKYQTVVRDVADEILDNQNVYFKISILQYTDDGTAVYTETFDRITNDFGLVTFNIGEGDLVETGVFEDIDWSDGPYYVKVEVDIDGPGGTYGYEVTGTSELLSVPYALYSAKAEEADEDSPLAIQLEEVTERLDEAKVGLVLWNKLGSVAEIQNSEIGLNGTIVGANYAFEPAKFGDGYVRKAAGSNYVIFPQSILQNLKSRGTVELWINPKVTNPVPYSYGVFPLLGNTFGNNSHVYIAWGDGVSGVGIYGSVNFDGTGHQTGPYEEQYVATVGVPFHVAICWDVDGIDGSSNTVRVYRNGEIVNTSDETWDDSDVAHNYDGFTLGMGPDAEGYDKYIVDNIKVWNFARTNFDDRETDDQTKTGDNILVSAIDDLTGSGLLTYGTVDANTTGIGAALYLASDGNYEEAVADAASTMPCVALAVEEGTGNKKVLLQGYFRNDTWSLTPGGLIYVDPVTAGALTQTIPSTSGQQVQIVGYATSATTMYFDPNLMLIEID